jgi:ABC-2 type transport system ATP-binding protein
MAAAIEAHALTKTYRGGIRALDGIGFSVESGTVFGLLGPNGAGKSTAVKILTTLSRPDSGQANVCGADVLGAPAQVRKLIGVVAQLTGVDMAATGRENITLQGRLHDLGGAGLKRRVSELLERLGLEEAADRVVRTYSGGMRRRLDIAMGLVHRPEVLFLDEPTAGLDPEVRALLWDEIGRLAAGEGLTIMLTTHYLEEADRLAHRLAILDHGRIVAEGSPEGLKGELRGDEIRVELGEPRSNGEVTAALGRVEGLTGLRLEGGTLHARAASGATAVPAVLAALESAAMPVRAVMVARPSLEEVFMRYAGRAYKPSGEEQGEPPA